MSSSISALKPPLLSTIFLRNVFYKVKKKFFFNIQEPVPAAFQNKLIDLIVIQPNYPAPLGEKIYFACGPKNCESSQLFKEEMQFSGRVCKVPKRVGMKERRGHKL